MIWEFIHSFFIYVFFPPLPHFNKLSIYDLIGAKQSGQVYDINNNMQLKVSGTRESISID